MRIAIILTGLGMGGAERLVCNLASSYAEKGHKVLIISMTGSAINRPDADEVELIELQMKKTPASFISAILKSRNLIKSFMPDVIHSHMFHANIFSRLLGLTIAIPKPRLICTAHNTNEGGGLRMLAYRMTDSFCDLTTNVSQEAVDVFVHKKASRQGRIIPVYNGIDCGKFFLNRDSAIIKRKELGIENSAQLLLSVGRLTEAKDFPNLLKAFHIVNSKRGNIHLAIIGIGNDESELKSLSKELGLDKHVHFLGLRHDVAEWMSAADLYVMSSAWEGMPLVLLEAMACQKIVVATDCGGVKEIVGESGFIVNSKDNCALASGIERALSLDSETRHSLELSARNRVVEYYSINTISELWLNIYKGAA